MATLEQEKKERLKGRIRFNDILRTGGQENERR